MQGGNIVRDSSGGATGRRCGAAAWAACGLFRVLVEVLGDNLLAF